MYSLPNLWRARVMTSYPSIKPCPICGTEGPATIESNKDWMHDVCTMGCSKCGTYKLTWEFELEFERGGPARVEEGVRQALSRALVEKIDRPDVLMTSNWKLLLQGP